MPDADAGAPVDTVLLDVDGTLIDSTYLHALAWMRAFTAHDLTPPQWWKVHRAIGMGGDRLVGEICGDEVEESLGDTLRDDWEGHYRELVPDLRPLPGGRRLRPRSARRGIPGGARIVGQGRIHRRRTESAGGSVTTIWPRSPRRTTRTIRSRHPTSWRSP